MENSEFSRVHASFAATFSMPTSPLHLQVFLNWKNQLKARSKKIKQLQDGNANANDKNSVQKFTDVEKRALKLWKEDIEEVETITVSVARNSKFVD